MEWLPGSAHSHRAAKINNLEHGYGYKRLWRWWVKGLSFPLHHLRRFWSHRDWHRGSSGTRHTYCSPNLTVYHQADVTETRRVKPTASSSHSSQRLSHDSIRRRVHSVRYLKNLCTLSDTFYTFGLKFYCQFLVFILFTLLYPFSVLSL